MLLHTRSAEHMEKIARVTRLTPCEMGTCGIQRTHLQTTACTRVGTELKRRMAQRTSTTEHSTPRGREGERLNPEGYTGRYTMHAAKARGSSHRAHEVTGWSTVSLVLGPAWMRVSPSSACWSTGTACNGCNGKSGGKPLLWPFVRKCWPW